MKKAEIWICDVCGKEQVGKCFPREWYEVSILSGYRHHGMGSNTDIEKDCCSKLCIKGVVGPLIKEEK